MKEAIRNLRDCRASLPTMSTLALISFLLYTTAFYKTDANPNPNTNPLSPATKRSWLPGENVTFVLQHDFNASFFFVEDAPERGIDPVRAFLLRAEENIRSLFHHLLYIPGCELRERQAQWGKSCETRKSHKTRIILDIGSNRGWYTLMAASYGHTVYAFDPQPHCSLLLRASVMMNEFQERVFFTHAFVTDVGTEMSVRKRTGCMGGFPNNNHAGYADHFRRPLDEMVGANETEVVGSVRLDEMFDGKRFEVLLLKMDIEGHESHAIESGMRLISSGAVRNIVMEFNLPMLGRQAEGIKVMKERSLELVKRLMGLGYEAKASHKGAWNKQDVMKIGEWERLFTLEKDAFVTIDVWFFK